MDATQIQPVLDLKAIQEKANEYALKGAIECIKEFYTGYNSPYKKAIDEELKKSPINWPIQLPDIIAMINDSLSKQIDALANEAISKTYIPMVKKFLTRVDKEIKFSDILKEFIECVEPEDYEECDCSVKEDSQYGWLSISISSEKKEYSFTLHLDSGTKKLQQKKYQLLGLPYERESYGNKMTFSTPEGAKVEMPFTKDLIADKFMSYLARIIICDSNITMDTHNFDEGMFPERCHCH